MYFIIFEYFLLHHKKGITSSVSCVKFVINCFNYRVRKISVCFPLHDLICLKFTQSFFYGIRTHINCVGICLIFNFFRGGVYESFSLYLYEFPNSPPGIQFCIYSQTSRYHGLELHIWIQESFAISLVLSHHCRVLF